MQGKAVLTNCPMSARKARLVVNNIRGLEVNRALSVLKYTNKESALFLQKLLLTAVNNWEQVPGNSTSADQAGLFIKEAFADEGPMLKRFRPAPHGRAHRIRKRRTHLTIIVENKTETSKNELTTENSIA